MGNQLSQLLLPCASGSEMRTVPGLTDDFGEIERVANFAGSLGNVERVDVLPFHQLGRYKWHQLGIPYKLEDVSPPANDLVERTCAVFRTAGLAAH